MPGCWWTNEGEGCCPEEPAIGPADDHIVPLKFEQFEDVDLMNENNEWRKQIKSLTIIVEALCLSLNQPSTFSSHSQPFVHSAIPLAAHALPLFSSWEMAVKDGLRAILSQKELGEYLCPKSEYLFYFVGQKYSRLKNAGWMQAKSQIKLEKVQSREGRTESEKEHRIEGRRKVFFFLKETRGEENLQCCRAEQRGKGRCSLLPEANIKSHIENWTSNFAGSQACYRKMERYFEKELLLYMAWERQWKTVRHICKVAVWNDDEEIEMFSDKTRCTWNAAGLKIVSVRDPSLAICPQPHKEHKQRVNHRFCSQLVGKPIRVRR